MTQSDNIYRNLMRRFVSQDILGTPHVQMGANPTPGVEPSYRVAGLLCSVRVEKDQFFLRSNAHLV